MNPDMMSNGEYNAVPGVEHALEAMLTTFAHKTGAPGLHDETWKIFRQTDRDFLTRVHDLDELVKKTAAYEPLSEVLFDLLMVQFLASEPHREEFFDTQEWQHIEDASLDRGTEMLNLLLYISEANETETEITLEDFLNEFLLVDTDEFQDEYGIYEPLIVHHDLLEMELADIRDLKSTLKDEAPLKELIVPFVLFFQQPSADAADAEETAGLSAFEASVLQALRTFNRA
jgi:hypothetical protein